ncbi:MAG: hypothetical protein Q4F03_04915 [Eubacteriales bacterium]|nr:hypothetical protein [Eubacteriales bacterium]
MAKYGKTGVTKDTPKNIMFGAGTIHKNLKYSESWNFEESIIGATSGGSKIKIVPEFVDIEADGVLVATKGLKVKVGETAKMEINFLETSKELVKSALIGKEGASSDTKMDLIESKPDLEDGDYLENIAFVGRTLAGKDIIVIMDNALCTSGFESEGENKKEGVGTYTFTCHADLQGDCDTLPYHIYFPKPNL